MEWGRFVYVSVLFVILFFLSLNCILIICSLMSFLGVIWNCPPNTHTHTLTHTQGRGKPEKEANHSRLIGNRLISKSFPGSSDGKASAYNEGDPGSISRSVRFLGEGNGNPLQYSCLENPTDLGSLVGYNPWGRKESDTTERLHFHFT